MINFKNRNYWNIVKGLGILCIVIGHSCYFAVNFVYLFHLAIFFFTTGYLYNERKYGDHPYLYFSTKIKANWKKYVIFSSTFILCHNILSKLGFIIHTTPYSISNIISSILNSFYFYSNEILTGALWFVPVYIMACSIFGAIIYFSRKISHGLK